jgi:monooxygenase
MAHDLDVLVVGAGLSGIAAGYHLQAQCPQKTYAILESREALGGTWDLFRYPGAAARPRSRARARAPCQTPRR